MPVELLALLIGENPAAHGGEERTLAPFEFELNTTALTLCVESFVLNN